MDPRLNQLLKWSVQNTASVNDPSVPTPTSTNGLNPEVIAALFGGPSDADLMKESMTVILSTHSGVSLDDKLIAFDNFEQLVENLDNANNLGPLSLWSPLLSCLTHEEYQIRKMAAWCIGTAVQNNERTQERLLAQGAIPRLVELATSKDENEEVRKKAVYALSSESRNYQPAMDVFTEELEKTGRNYGKIDAADMGAVDAIIKSLRQEISQAT